MRIDKITGFALQLFLLVSCAGGPVEGYVPQEEYDDLKQEYSQLKESSSATRDQFVQQAEAMDKILQDLARISGSTVVLRSDVEKGTARLTQVEQIENRLVDIKTKLDGLDNLTKQNATYRKVITSLRKSSPSRGRFDAGTRRSPSRMKPSPASPGPFPPRMKQSPHSRRNSGWRLRNRRSSSSRQGSILRISETDPPSSDGAGTRKGSWT